MKWLLMLAGCLTLALAQTPVFDGPYPVYDNGVAIDVGNYGAPTMYDWDRDGRKDLICGQFEGGYIRFYRNVGSDSAPEFNGFEYMSANGSQITLPYG
jgi:hypothetical protein